MSKPKIWICGQVASHGQAENMRQVVKSFPYFDGAIWTVNFNNDNYSDHDGVIDILKAAIIKGDILRTRWVALHNIGMTMFLQCGLIKNGDWVMVIDAQEDVKETWLKGMRDRVDGYEKDGITTMFWGRPYLFKYFDQMTFQGTTHCWPYPLLDGKQANIQDESAVIYDAGGVHFGGFLYNKKNLDDTTFYHATKYFLYKVGNESQNQYGKFGSKVVLHHENMRQVFRRYAEEKLGITDLASLEDYFRKEDYDKIFIEYVETENVFKDFFRRKILNQSREDILRNRYNWSFTYYLKTKSVDQTLSNYIGVRNQYNKQLGLPME